MIATAYIHPDSGINCGRIVERVLRSMDWSLKHAALEMGEYDDATWSRGLNGLGPLDMHRLAMLPSKFWWKFLRSMIAAILRCEDQQRDGIEKRRA